MYWDMTDKAFDALTAGATIELKMIITGGRGERKITTLSKVAEVLESEGFVVRRVDNGTVVKLQAAKLPNLEDFPYGR